MTHREQLVSLEHTYRVYRPGLFYNHHQIDDNTGVHRALLLVSYVIIYVRVEGSGCAGPGCQ